MSPLECVEPAIQRSSIADSPRDRLEQSHREPSEAFSNQEEAEAGSYSGESEPSGVRHVGPCHLGLALNGLLERHTEGPWEYLPGGHHPVHLGDRIGDYKQFKVIHKLGSGGFGIVWLCSWVGTDPTIYVAIKILKAEWSGEDCREQENIRWLQGIADRDPDVEEWCLLPWQEFTLDGPNGTHQCFVYEVAASGLGNISHVVDDVDVFLRKLTRQAAEAMSVLHRHNICHGDFRPSNILLRVNGLDVSWRSTSSTQVCCHQIRIADFGESFIAGNPPPHGSGIPFQYAAPEVALDEKAGKESDIFALAATMYEIRFGNRLFRIQEDGVEAYVHFMVKYCGRLPEPWWSRWKETWKKVTEPANEDELQDESTVKLWHIRKAVCEPIGHRVSTPESWAYPHKLLGRNGVIGCDELIPVKEKIYLADLLYRMTALDPRERITIDEVLEHRWFRYEAENAEPARHDKFEERKDDLSRTENSDPDASGNQAIVDELPQAVNPEKPQKVADYNLPQLKTNHTGIHNNSPTAEAETAEGFAIQPAPKQSEPAEHKTLPSTGASELQLPDEQKAEVLSLNIPLTPAAAAIRLPESGKPQYAAAVTLQPVEDAKLIYIPTNLSPVHEIDGLQSCLPEHLRPPTPYSSWQMIHVTRTSSLRDSSPMAEDSHEHAVLLPRELPDTDRDEYDGFSRQRRHLGLLSTTFLITNRMIGTAIFSTPSAIAASVGSAGAALALWVVGLILAYCGLFIWIELGSLMPRSGGIGSVVVAENILLALNGSATDWVKRGLAIAVLAIIATIHIRFSALGVKIMILILFLIIVAGLRALRGDLPQIPDPASSLKSPFTGSSSSVSRYTNALFKILATYQGWSNAAYVLDEVKDPRKVLKIAGVVGVGLVGILYTLTNISYFIVATPDEISKTGVTVVALLIGKVFGDTMLWLTATLAALSSFGNLMTASFTMSRVVREFAREGIVPYSRFFAATTSSGSPSAAFLLVFLSSAVMILFIPFDVSQYAIALVNVLVVIALFIIRRKQPHRRTFRAWTPVIYLFLASQVFLLVTPFIPAALDTGRALPPWLYSVVALLVFFGSGVYWFMSWEVLPRRGQFVWTARESVLADGSSVVLWDKVKIN
ncbi:hypothetical protein AN2551.2 [Aspergillus nidulans FGSC A4]|nr:hypothetical protein AN2551.2 [Aspergillus nidulans FGSC A4]|eukprot:XP_660155.1 hypothetical protein AN2551.2 [Aspergillus nidulans FGSC A4]